MSFNDLSIRYKLRAIIMLISVIVLILASSAFIITDVVSLRRTMIENLSTLAQVIGGNCVAPLTFDDKTTAKETLAALVAEPHITEAYIFDNNGNMFAEYIHNNNGNIKPPDIHNHTLNLSNIKNGGYKFHENHLDLYKRIIYNKERLGFIFLMADLKGLYSSINMYIAISAIVMLASLLVAYFLSIQLQRFISAPILRLADAMKVVKDEHNYSVMVEKFGNDELGALIDGFNEMLEQIAIFTDKLSESNQDLEHAVTELKMAKEEVDEANEQLSQYAYVVSHDIKTPLRAIHNYADFLREDLEKSIDGEQKEYLDNLGRSVQQAENLVDDLLRLSRLGRQDLNFEEIPMGDFLKKLLASLNLPSDVEMIMEDNWPTIDSEPTLLTQIFQNLINNAIKFNKLSYKRVEIGFRENNEDEYEFFVRDNGIGIAPQYQQQIFRVFQRLHTNKEYEGTGIGLAIIKKAASKIHGSIRLESEAGKGSTFFLTLPISSKMESAA